MKIIDIDQWQAMGSEFRFNNHRIFYIDTKAPNKAALLLLHGFPTSSWDWHQLWPKLSTRYRLITLDLLGYGFSSKPVKYDYSFFEQADIVESLLEHCDIDEVQLLAHDYGDTVAQELLARDIADKKIRYTSNILLNGGIIFDAIQLSTIQKLLLSPFGPLVAKLMSYSKFKKQFSQICYVPRPEQELEFYWQQINLNNGRAVIPKLVNYIQERRQYQRRWVSAMEKHPSPLLFINGIEDPISGKKMVDSFSSRVPSKKVVELKEVGHYPQVEAPSQVLSIMENFWNGQN
ncbi:alpha/beta fold hydrolase [Aliikangiella sp. G2MR2-5]|uniref:alpha/beta fold hydrolase n=1 Tax=Aliikangiella sp. G2MR2-5 TaxID=2788943 RepID=UPI0018A8C12E|nr:alpha/beta hydrolase [Aliikangiella sp. G2MR2-5]